MNCSGSGKFKKVPKASRITWSAAPRSASSKGRIATVPIAFEAEAEDNSMAINYKIKPTYFSPVSVKF